MVDPAVPFHDALDRGDTAIVHPRGYEGAAARDALGVKVRLIVADARTGHRAD